MGQSFFTLKIVGIIYKAFQEGAILQIAAKLKTKFSV